MKNFDLPLRNITCFVIKKRNLSNKNQTNFVEFAPKREVKQVG
jgi:hypothetical protein